MKGERARVVHIDCLCLEPYCKSSIGRVYAKKDGRSSFVEIDCTCFISNHVRVDY